MLNPVKLYFNYGRTALDFALKQKGFVKIRNFRKNPKKLNYIYVLTPKGIAVKTKLTINFMKRKMIEYDQLKKELKEKK